MTVNLGVLRGRSATIVVVALQWRHKCGLVVSSLVLRLCVAELLPHAVATLGAMFYGLAFFGTTWNECSAVRVYVLNCSDMNPVMTKTGVL